MIDAAIESRNCDADASQTGSVIIILNWKTVAEDAAERFVSHRSGLRHDKVPL